MDIRMEKRQAFASDMKETTCVPSAARTHGVRSHHVRCFGFPTLFYAYKHRIKTACCIYQNGDISRNGGGEEFSPFSFLFLHHSTCFASGCPHYLEGMRSLSLPAGNPFPAQQLRSGGGRLPSRYEHLWTDKNPAGSIVTAEMELASSFIRILRSHSLPPSLSLLALFHLRSPLDWRRCRPRRPHWPSEPFHRKGVSPCREGAPCEMIGRRGARTSSFLRFFVLAGLLVSLVGPFWIPLPSESDVP